MRLQQFLARAGVASRRACEDLIRAGRVTMYGRVVQLGESAEPGAVVALDGVPVGAEAFAYYLFNKPMHVITAMSDPRGRTCVGDYTRNLGERVFPVGRLDYDTEGLLLLTNDGGLTQRLTHPSHGADKRYEALVKGRLSEGEIEALLAGVMLDEPAEDADDEGAEPRPAVAFAVRSVPVGVRASRVYMTIREGRNRVVRRMLEAVGHPVEHLKRVGVGSLELGSLSSGALRALTDGEVRALMEGDGRGA